MPLRMAATDIVPRWWWIFLVILAFEVVAHGEYVRVLSAKARTDAHLSHLGRHALCTTWRRC